MKFLVVSLFFVVFLAAARGQSTWHGKRPAQQFLPSSRPSSVRTTRSPQISHVKIPVNPNRNIKNVTMETRKSRGTKSGTGLPQISHRIKYFAEPNEVEVVRHPPIVIRLLNGFCKLRNEIQNNKIMKPVVKYIIGMIYGWFTDHWGGNTLNNVIAEAIADFRAYFDERCKDPEEESEQKPAMAMEMNEGYGGGYNLNSNFKMAPVVDMSVTPYPYDYAHKDPHLHKHAHVEVQPPPSQYFKPGEEQEQPIVQSVTWSQGQGHQHEHDQDWRVTNELTSGGHEYEHEAQASRTEHIQIDGSHYNRTAAIATAQTQTR